MPVAATTTLAAKVLPPRFGAVLRELIRRDLQSRYSGTALGPLWVLAQPLWMMAIFTFVFSGILRVSPPGVPQGGFIPFLLSGLLPWIGFQEGVARSATAIIDQASIVKRLRFPHELLVITVVVAALIQQLAAMSLLAIVLLAVGFVGGGDLWLMLVAVPLQFALTLALGFVLAAVCVPIRDLVQVATISLTALFYLTPIVYSLEMVPAALRPWVAWNPLAPLLGLYRQALMPGDWVQWPAVAWTCGGALAAVTLAWAWFRRASPSLVDDL